MQSQHGSMLMIAIDDPMIGSAAVAAGEGNVNAGSDSTTCCCPML